MGLHELGDMETVRVVITSWGKERMIGKAGRMRGKEGLVGQVGRMRGMVGQVGRMRGEWWGR